MTPYLTTPPVRRTLYWQAGATLFGALVAGILLGANGAISALLGGLIILLAGVAYAVVISVSNSPSAETTLRTMILAEAAKIGIIVLSMWLVITAYKDLDGAAFFAAFVVTVLLNRVAFWARGPTT
jgi:F0F1-type ATP synthase assembly protein I